MFQLTVHGKDINELRKNLALASVFHHQTIAVNEEPAIEEPAKKRGRPAKVEAAAEVDEDFDLGEEAATEDGEEGPTKAVEHSLEDVIGAFKTYAQKNSREKAAKVLAKFKVKSVRDLPAAKFGDVLSALGA